MSFQTSEIENDVAVVSVVVLALVVLAGVDAAIIGAAGDAVAIEPSETAVEVLVGALTDLRRRHQDENEIRTVVIVTATCLQAVAEVDKSLDECALHLVLQVPSRETRYLVPDRPVRLVTVAGDLAFDHLRHHATALEDVGPHLVIGAQPNETGLLGERETIALVETAEEIPLRQTASVGLAVAGRAHQHPKGVDTQTRLVAQDPPYVGILNASVVPHRHRMLDYVVEAQDESQFANLLAAAPHLTAAGD